MGSDEEGAETARAHTKTYVTERSRKPDKVSAQKISDLRADPSGQAIDEKRRTHCDNEYDDDADDELLHHVFGVDLFFVPVRDGDLDADVRAPDDDDRRERDDDIEPEAIHQALQFCYDLGKVTVQSGFRK